MKEMEDNSVDSIVTDPPYGLSAARNSGKSSKGGFMGKEWDYDVPSVEIWREALRVLKPGGHLLAFSGTRTYHRMVVNIEDAGFEIRDSIVCWLYFSGFPKSHNISKALDKRGGNNDLAQEVADKLKQARESRGMTKSEADELFCNGSTNYSWMEGRKDRIILPNDDVFQNIVDEWPELKPYQEKVKSANREIIAKSENGIAGGSGEFVSGNKNTVGFKGSFDITSSATPEAKQWDGWGTALKPAHEPVCVARKPLIGTVVENVLEYGTGALNIDGCRIEYDPESYERNKKASEKAPKEHEKAVWKDTGHKKRVDVFSPKGRWPSNVIMDEVAGAILDKQAPSVGNMMNANRKTTTTGGTGNAWTTSSKNEGDSNGIFDGLGGGSRFFYCPKVSQAERNAGLESLEDKEKYADFGLTNRIQDGVITNDRTNNAAYTSKNNHPTVKPISLMRYLAKLVTKEGGIVLDPFMGSGSTGIAACLEGFDFVGIEMDEEYLNIARHRIAHWGEYEIEEAEFIPKPRSTQMSISDWF
jgi:DNA modification methylase